MAVCALPLLLGVLNCSSDKDNSGTSTGGSANAGASSGGAVSGGAASGGMGTSRGGSEPMGELHENGLKPLPLPPGDGGVPQPSGTPGNLKVLDWAGFKAAVSFTFDDTNSSQIAHYDELQALGARYTFYLITGKSEINDPAWVRAIEDGHELGNHTQSHRMAATEDDIDAASDVIASKFGAITWTMASPYGDASYVPLAKPRFLLNRGVSNGLIGPSDNSDPFNTPCFIPAEGAPASAINAQVDSARSAGKWRIVLVHGFTGGTDGAYQPVDIAEFAESVTYAQSLGDVWIDTMASIGAYWRGQKAFSEAGHAQKGDVESWHWTLPPHFPKGRTLRVTVDGGSLSQGGPPLVWDEHGFYEVDLDAGVLTLSP
jgi:peptidoglycan/xylan/chitin deacetylase (PgdA/CDA1 family)